MLEKSACDRLGISDRQRWKLDQDEVLQRFGGDRLYCICIESENWNRDLEQLLMMGSYCENKLDCRRKLQIEHLGEQFDPRA